ncbi:MAG: YjgN family protein [Hyphomicrobium sp.]
MDQPAPTTSPNGPITGRGGQAIDISFENRSDRLIGLGFVNGLLRVVTLGLYSFWAKTEVRRKLWSFTRLNGEPLEYTGTGKELCLGFLIMFMVIAIPAMLTGVAVAIAFAGNRTALTIYQFLAYLVFFLLIGNALYRARRYRLSRTRWRGIRGALVGRPGAYGWMYFWTLAVPIVAIAAMALAASWATGPAVGGVFVAVGCIAALWVLPWRANALQGRITRETRFGDTPLTYDGAAGPLYKRYLYAWFGSAVAILAGVGATFGWVLSAKTFEAWRDLGESPAASEIATVVGIWIAVAASIAVITASYRASQFKHFAHHTAIGASRFRSEVNGTGLAWLVVSNWLLAALGLILGAIAGGALIYAFGAAPQLTDLETGRAEITAVQIAIALVPIIVLSTMATTFAQFRSARYFLSRLKLDGPVDLAGIAQSADAGPKRGEGLAQVFDLDAF